MKKNLIRLCNTCSSAAEPAPDVIRGAGRGAHVSRRAGLLVVLALVCWQPGVRASVTGDVQGGTALAAKARNIAAFGGTNKFYVGTHTDADKVDQDNNFARVALKRVDGASSLSAVPMSYAGALLRNIALDKLAVTPAGLPVATDLAVNGKAILITDTKDGKTALTNDVAIKDGAGNAVNKTNVALAASNDYVFLAVPVRGGTDGEISGDGGIGVCYIDKVKQKLVAFNGYDSDSADPRAVMINITKEAAKQSTGPLAVAHDAEIAAPKKVDMYWDEPLGRLYVGVNNLTSAGANGDCAVAVLVGGIEKDGLLHLYSIIGNQTSAGVATQIPVVADGGIFCVKSGGAADKLGISKVRVMHTSTGKSYLIVVGGTAAAVNELYAAKLTVYALPLQGKDCLNPFDYGTIAKKTDLRNTPRTTTTDDMTLATGAQTFGVGGDATSLKAVVGYNAAYIVHTATGTFDAANAVNNYAGVQDIQVVGDTVYIALVGANGNVADAANTGEEAGIFSSTALFDENGLIRGWTPWQRAVNTLVAATGANQPVKFFGVDEKTGNTWYLKNDGTAAFVSQWSKGDRGPNRNAADKELSAVLDTAFGDKGGVLGMFSFDAETPGFRTADIGDAGRTIPIKAYDQFSMMVATGNGRVALIEAGNAAAATEPFKPTQVYKNTRNVGVTNVAVDGDTVYLFDEKSDSGKALTGLGPITCAEVARIPATANATGWVFVGGEGGIAVMRKPADGSGWATAALNTGLGKLDASANDGTKFPGKSFAGVLETLFQFAQVERNSAEASLEIKNVRKMISDGTSLFILTKDKVQRLEIALANFADLSAKNALSVKLPVGANRFDTLATVENLQVGGAAALGASDEFYDMVLLEKRHAGNDAKVAVATSKGLLISPAIANDGTNAHLLWTKPTGTDGAASFTSGPALKLDMTYQKRGGPTIDNTAEGNLYVTALDKDQKNVNVYRFNVSGGTVKQIREPYQDANGNSVDYFYRVGKIEDVAGLEWNGNLDMQAQARHYGQTGAAEDFVDRVAMGPESSAFLKAGQTGSAIDLGLNLDKSFHPSTICKDAASGSIYVVTNKGVRVNE